MVQPLSNDNEQIIKLVEEYLDLSTASRLSNWAIQRQTEILTLAQENERLNSYLCRVDEFIEKRNNFDHPLSMFAKNSFINDLKDELNQNQVKLTSDFLSIDEFLCQMKKLESEENTPKIEQLIEQLKDIFSKLKLSESLLKSFTNFREDQFSKEIILQRPNFDIFLICWKKGQYTSIHSHLNFIDLIRVYQGTLIHKRFKIDEENLAKDGSPDKISASLKEELVEDEMTSINLNQIHQLTNEDEENLITLHLQYYIGDKEVDNKKVYETKSSFSKSDLKVSSRNYKPFLNEVVPSN